MAIAEQSQVTGDGSSLSRRPRRPAGGWGEVMRRLLSDGTSVAALVTIAVLAVVAVFAPFLVELMGMSAIDPDRSRGLDEFGVPVAPGGEFWLGTDFVGRDILSRILVGTQNTFFIAIVSALAAIVVGTAIGVVAGLYGGIIDTILAAVIDFVIALPFLVVAMAIVVIHGASVKVLMLTIILFSWSTVARMVRSLVLTIREMDYIKATKTLGASDLRIVVRHILPNIAGPVLTYGSLLIPQIVVLEASLSFLGLGVQPPNPTWGGIIAENQGNYAIAWWSILFPGVALLVSTLSFNLLGDGLRDAMAPDSSRRRKRSMKTRRGGAA